VKLIVGLGNPEKKFEKTRHNLGFMVADYFANLNGLSWRINPDWNGAYCKGEGFVLLKPSTYMNLSGESVSPTANFFNIEKKDILVIHDDLDLEFGKMRISFDSSSAGHNGVESVIKSLGSPNFARLRIGIGRPSRDHFAEASRVKKASIAAKAMMDRPDGKEISPEKYVLKKFTAEEEKKLPVVIQTAAEAVRIFTTSGLDATMNQFN